MDPFVAEIRIFAFNFAPKNWALCQGQLLPLSQNTALFSLLGTFYGGDGKSNFALPDLQNRVPLHAGHNQPGPGLSIYDLGQNAGASSVTLLQSEIPAHSHAFNGTTSTGTATSAQNNVLATVAGGGTKLNKTSAKLYSPVTAPLVTLSPQALTVSGGSLPHNNLMPYVGLNFCIALAGVFPPR